ncbi:hypothetical protein GUJ93_ZPchr0007g3216 [Zizania palustris]|uniref:Uncharacterized protein n=1 Tax=Zizania palustris TaxID=103762 RepID=A0A8J5TC02_ZIZPA|nr:hypothetical protein GUJ93_ZPchr0007g3216 [Zizania palustris]
MLLLAGVIVIVVVEIEIVVVLVIEIEPPGHLRVVAAVLDEGDRHRRRALFAVFAVDDRVEAEVHAAAGDGGEALYFDGGDREVYRFRAAPRRFTAAGKKETDKNARLASYEVMRNAG